MKRIWILLIVAAALVAMWLAAMYMGFATKQNNINGLTEGTVEYSQAVADYNDDFNHFPGNVFGRAFGFTPYKQ